ncbi:MAG: hypothetical protein J7J91_06955 [Deltaproteobacteria bacterium]|nr:hypothetical protein [Deltaproteobacteria bacterium]
MEDSINIEFKIAINRPGIALSIKSKDFESIMTALSKVKDVKGFIEACHHSYDLNRKEHTAFVIVSFKDMNTLEEAVNALTNYTKDLSEVLMSFVRLAKYSDRYMTPIFPTYILVGDPVAMIRFPRLFAIIKMIVDALGSGAYSFARMIAENDGKVLYETHKDVLTELARKEDIKSIVDYILVGLGHVGLLPKVSSTEKESLITIHLKSRAILKRYIEEEFLESLISFTKHYIRSLLLRIFALLGFEVKYAGVGIIREEYSIIVNTPRRSYKIVIEGTYE